MDHKQRVQHRMGLVVNLFVFLKLLFFAYVLFFAFVAAMRDLLHNVEAIHGPC